jgi:ankyrin repeat protein
LLLASAADRLDVARLLVALGADPDAQDDQQDSAWLVTGVTGSVAMLEVLLPAGPNPALRYRFGRYR